MSSVLPLNRKWTLVPCAVGLFLSDPSRQGNKCQLQPVNWSGPETIYISNRKWAYSTVKPQTFNLQCAAKTGSKPHVMDSTLTGVGIFGNSSRMQCSHRWLDLSGNLSGKYRSRNNITPPEPWSFPRRVKRPALICDLPMAMSFCYFLLTCQKCPADWKCQM